MLPVVILQVRFQPLTRPFSLGAQPSERVHPAAAAIAIAAGGTAFGA